MKSRKILVWFRNDLRLHDNEVLVDAVAKSDSILPVYFFDPRYFEYTEEGKIIPGNSRVQFLIESVAALRESLKKLGGNLLIIEGKPEDHLPKLVEQYEIAEVYHHREVATKETDISSNVEDILWKIKTWGQNSGEAVGSVFRGLTVASQPQASGTSSTSPS